jgi:peptide/nickel transport system substrate-binding protein
VNNSESPKEFRLKSSSSILNYIRHFSATEKTIFGILVIIAGISAFAMANMISGIFMTEIPSRGGELREGVVGLPHVMNPVLAVTDVDRDISTLLYSGLMKYSGNDLVTDLAESYKISDDGLTYTFKLRPNIYFHDGTPVTTADIAYTIQQVQNIALKSPRRADCNNVAVTVTSPSEIKFTLKQPYSPFITNTTIGILPKHIWGNFNDDQFSLSEFNIEPIGSGPYYLKSLLRDGGGIPDEIQLAISNKYYGNKPYINTISFIFFSDSEKAFSALQAGTIDSLASVSSEQAKIISSKYSSEYRVVATPLPRIFGVFFNQSNNPALADKNVRLALQMSVDKDAIVKTILNGYGIQISGPTPYGMNIPNTIDSDGDKDNKADLAAAATVLEKAGWKKNISTGIYEKKNTKNVIQSLTFDIYTADTTDLKQTAELVKDSWNALGAKVTVKVFESSDLYQNIIRPRKYDAILFGQLIGKDQDFYAFWHSSQRNSPGLNVSMYVNNKTDALLESIRNTSDETVRKTKYIELDKLIRADIPAIFLYSPDFIYILPNSVRNTEQGDINIKNITIPSDRFNTVSDWYIKTEKVWKIFDNK